MQNKLHSEVYGEVAGLSRAILSGLSILSLTAPNLKSVAKILLDSANYAEYHATDHASKSSKLAYVVVTCSKQAWKGERDKGAAR